MWALLIVFILLLIIGAPIGIALGAASVIFIIFYSHMDPVFVPSSFLFFMHHYTIMAVPFFIYAGFLMERTGIIKQLFGLSEALLSWLPGGFGVATLFACVIFAAITGSSVAEASAMTIIALPEMKKRGYSIPFAAGIICCGGTLGLLIPPSLSLLMFGVVTETSVVKLFFAGFIPGFIMAGLLMAAVIFIGWRKRLETGRFDLQGVLVNLKASIPGLAFPIIVLGGLYGGLFTPTEAGAAACGYALIYGALAQRKKFFKELIPATVQAVRLTSVVFFLLGSVGIFQAVAANEYWPQKMADAVTAMNLSPLTFLFGYMILILILGCFLDGMAMILLTVPVVFPIAQALDIDPLHLGILMTINIELGVITPPVGFNLYAVSGIGRIPVNLVLKGAAPFFFIMLAFLVFMIFMPGLTSWLPDLIFKPIQFGGG
jgi:C4-dicarboxylate transporter DctM subunit